MSLMSLHPRCLTTPPTCANLRTFLRSHDEVASPSQLCGRRGAEPRGARHGRNTRRLLDAVLEQIKAERVLLNARGQQGGVAAYRAWGYHKVGDARPWNGAALHDVMVLDLR
ncbi:hypothetical protein [Streptomyces eurocidicus]|uniref:Uncharacterized protein with PIN domain n=1 Tax=Streptomyces eurocidicus TaxID=66423 RepID=A0A7W8B8A9_STREU|nr:hypothetical protein [Streptomyces eurocidicus]MBB5116849.1 uncharacterized protein with PIN domain [Streptomyces eurocidicus]